MMDLEVCNFFYLKAKELLVPCTDRVSEAVGREISLRPKMEDSRGELVPTKRVVGERDRRPRRGRHANRAGVSASML